MSKKSIKNFDELPLRDKLEEKVRIYYKTIWKEKDEVNLLTNWIGNFDENEETHMLFLLSKFMYFGNLEIRQILTSIYRDLFEYPIIEEFRRGNGDTLDELLINNNLDVKKKKAKFLGVGNPSESGVHLLYYFRQENCLGKDDFIYVSDIFKGVEKEIHSKKVIEFEIRNKDIDTYIFLDDFCGSGSQAKQYLLNDLILLKKIQPDVQIYYFMMFSTEEGMKNLADLKYTDIHSIEKPIFNKIESIFILDNTFKAFDSKSRYFENCPSTISKSECMDINTKYGSAMPCGPLGYRDGELLVSFFHNTPDNSLPIFWCYRNWNPIFKRYNKIY